MARFDVHKPTGARALLLICQSSYLDDLPTRFALPLIPVGAKAPIASRLHPVVNVDGVDYVLTPNLAATIRTTALGPKVGSLERENDTIMAALDLLITGF